ncbi:MAG: hypothetical protein ALAOOOJD_04033 [bacterium]|nr:hypothetical protein [bacterium]
MNSKNFHGNIRMKKVYFVIFCVTFYVGCSQPTETEVITSVPTTRAKGPGRPAYLAGNIRDYLRYAKAVTNTHLYVLDEINYADTVLHVLINSTDASFRLTEMPLKKVDLIFTNGSYLSRKISGLQLKPIRNSFYLPNSSGFFIDSTLTIIAVADSANRPDAPRVGIEGYVNRIVVRFKTDVPDSVSWRIVQVFKYDTLSVFHFHDSVFDPEPGDIYHIIYARHTNFLQKQRLLYFNWKREVIGAGPIILEDILAANNNLVFQNDFSGEKIKTLIDGRHAAGNYMEIWEAGMHAVSWWHPVSISSKCAPGISARRER